MRHTFFFPFTSSLKSLEFEIPIFPHLKSNNKISNNNHQWLWICKLRLILTLSYLSEAVRRRRWHPTPVLLPGKSHGQRSLVGCSPWGREESDTTEQLPFHFSLSCIGEGNGNPLQCSCLENPRDRGACWVAFYGVIQSQTRLNWLSSSSSEAVMPGFQVYHFIMKTKHNNPDQV